MELRLTENASYYSAMNAEFYETFKEINTRSIQNAKHVPAGERAETSNRFIPINRSKLAFIQELSNKNVLLNRDTFFEVNASNTMGNASDVDITKVRAIFLDFDAKAGHVMPECFEVEPSFIIQTSPGSYHVYWIITDSYDLEMWSSLMRYLIELYKSDIKVCNLSRLLRAPGSIHIGSGELCKVVFVGNRNDFDMNELTSGFSGFMSWHIQQAKEAAAVLIQRQQRDEAARERMASMPDELDLTVLVNNLKSMVCTQMSKREESKNGRNDGIVGYSRQIAKYLIHLGCESYLQYVEDIIYLAIEQTSLNLPDSEVRRQMDNGVGKAEKFGMQPGDEAELAKFMARHISDPVLEENLPRYIAKLGYGVNPSEDVIWNYKANKKYDKDGMHAHMGKFKFINVAEDPEDEPVYVRAIKVWYDTPEWWVKIEGVVWEPSKSEGLIEVNDKYFWNGYADKRITPRPPSAEYVSAFKTFLNTFVHEEDHDMLLAYCKNAYECPGERPWFGLELYSADMGTGKTSVAERLGRICGRQYSKKANLEKLDGDYSDEFTSSLILRVSEVAERGEQSTPRPVITEKLKELIAEDDIMSNAKYGARGMGALHFRMILTTNNGTAIDHKSLKSRIFQVRFKGLVDGGSRYDNQQFISALFAGIDDETQDAMFAGFLNAYEPTAVVERRSSAPVTETYEAIILADEQDSLDVRFLEYITERGAVSPLRSRDMERLLLLFMAEKMTLIKTQMGLSAAIRKAGPTFKKKTMRFGDDVVRAWVWETTETTETIE